MARRVGRGPCSQYRCSEETREEAIERGKRFLAVMGEGESKIRLMQGLPAFEVGQGQSPRAALT